MANSVFIARSIDGHIATKTGNIDWLHELPNPEGNDFGYNDFMEEIDAIVMGRNTFEKVLSFEKWHYTKKVFVLSNSIKEPPSELKDRVEFVSGELEEIISHINKEGFKNLYIDGGKVIQAFLKEDLINKLIISTIPILLGEGIPLFSSQASRIRFSHEKTITFGNGITQTHYSKI